MSDPAARIKVRLREAFPLGVIEWPVLERILDEELPRSGLLEALSDAASSLEAIAARAGQDELLKDMLQVRGYANSRATAARAAAEGAPVPNPHVGPDLSGVVSPDAFLAQAQTTITAGPLMAVAAYIRAHEAASKEDTK